jgi:hypothetical protein
MKLLKLAIILTICLFYSCNDITNELEGEKSASNSNLLKTNTVQSGFEISYWVDIDLRTNNGRGYWFHVADRPADIVPTSYQIWAACSRLKFTYHANMLYVIYHRQFEINEAKAALQLWKFHANSMGLTLIPIVVLEDYVAPNGGVNFTDIEIPDFAEWCINNINPDEFGVYDIYGNRQGANTAQNTQLGIIRNRIGNKIIRLGLQPGEAMNSNLLRGVEDTWTAECQGLTNALWEFPVSYLGTNNYGKNLLVNWVNERVVYESRKVSWNLIPVAWDYDNPVDPYAYICPGDDALINDPPVAGRINLCHSYIASVYPSGGANSKFGGYSCDLRILELNSVGCGETPTFYEKIAQDLIYTGRFSAGLNQVAAVFDLYDN